MLEYLQGLDSVAVAARLDTVTLRRKIAKPLNSAAMPADRVIEDLIDDVAGGLIGSAGGRTAFAGALQSRIGAFYRPYSARKRRGPRSLHGLHDRGHRSGRRSVLRRHDLAGAPRDARQRLQPANFRSRRPAHGRSRCALFKGTASAGPPGRRVRCENIEKSPRVCEGSFFDGSRGWARTSDPLINSQLLYQLSYSGLMVSGDPPLLAILGGAPSAGDSLHEALTSRRT